MIKDWNVLIDREIINMIIGDSKVTDDMFLEYKMPYMSGPNICEFGSKLGIDKDYWNSDKLSRWMYMENVLKYAINNNKINDFFKELFELKRFKKVENKEYYSTVNTLYYDLVHGLMNKINEILFFDKCHIEYNIETWQFALIDDDDNIRIESKNIEKIDKQYIKRLKNEIDTAIKNSDYESCITKSRTLLEEIMIYGIEKKGEIVEAKGNINKLYNQFKTLYSMHQDKNMDKRVNNLLSGFEKIITAISNMRDENSDSHGAGEKRISIEKRHATLFANSSVTMSDFLLSVIDKKMT